MRFDLDLPAWKWPFYVMRHPFEGYDDLRWKKGYNMKVAWVIVIAFFIISVASAQFTGFLFNDTYVKVFNIVPYFSSSVILFLTWVVGNWSLCTLFDGEGTMRNIFCVSAYALLPYLFSELIVIIASNFLLRTEGGFISFFRYLGIVWSIVLMISGMKTVHQYSIPKTLVAMFFTVVAMAIILFLAVLLLTLFQQVFVFGYSIYTELMYRFSI
ncbi:MAG: YIP1 family protein [Ruminiclostridium sp.]|nr:YIP1 family protein [Ruminiclostridium sp.]